MDDTLTIIRRTEMTVAEIIRNLRTPLPRSYIAMVIGYLVLASTLIFCSHPAQTRRRIPEPQAARTADQVISDMKLELGLTQEQEVNIRPIIEEQVKKRNELIQKHRDQGRKGLDSLQDDLKDLRISTESRLQYFLTNDQMVKYGVLQQAEDQKIAGITSRKSQEEVGQEKPGGRGHRSGRFRDE